LDKRFLRYVLDTWKTIWFPIYGEDFEGFCEFVFKNHNVDISSKFYLKYDYELVIAKPIECKARPKPKIKPINIPIPPKDTKDIGQNSTPRIESKRERPNRWQ
jgi:hypothetical protein